MAEVIDLHMDVLFAAVIDERRVCTSGCLIRLKEQDLTSLFSRTVVRFEPFYADQRMLAT
jgi:hypothetical protein